MTTPTPESKRRPSAPVIVAIVACVIAGAALALAVVIVGQVSGLTASDHALTASNRALQAQAAKAQAQAQQAQAQAASVQAQVSNTRKGATLANLGVCVAVSASTLNLTEYTGPVTYLQDLNITSPSLTAGVASCPSGSFVPVAPQGG